MEVFLRQQTGQFFRDFAAVGDKLPVERFQIGETGSGQGLPERACLRMEFFERGLIFRGFDIFCPVGVVADDPADLKREAVFVILVGVVQHVPHFVHENPAEFFVDDRIVGVVVDGFVADQADAFHDPAPAVFRQRTGYGNIVRHIPGQIGRGSGKTRLQFGDPVCQLDHFKIISGILQRRGSQPQNVRQNAAETAERHGCENHHRRGVADLPGGVQMMCFDDCIEPVAGRIQGDGQNARDCHQRQDQYQIS